MVTNQRRDYSTENVIAATTNEKIARNMFADVGRRIVKFQREEEGCGETNRNRKRRVRPSPGRGTTGSSPSKSNRSSLRWR